MRQLALYVQQTAQGDQTKILASGFQVTNVGHHPQSPLEKAVILQIKNEVSGQLLIRLKPEHNAIAYEGQYSTDNGVTWKPAGTFPQARHIVVPGLTPGTNYTFRFRALGGSTGAGDWSDSVSHMAT
ncbi:MAG: fibronectin type III domain-containing protein [Limisphaerales bacterium]